MATGAISSLSHQNTQIHASTRSPTPSSNTINTAMHYLTRINMGYSALTGTVYTIIDLTTSSLYVTLHFSDTNVRNAAAPTNTIYTYTSGGEGGGAST
eukprot:COSAG01_NODE_5328_length_4331_cov_68.471881_1_plen_98_part_00